MTVQPTRRQFIKASTTIGVFAAAAGTTACSPIFRALTEEGQKQVEEDVWVPTTCLACAADNKCGLLAHRVNGVLVKIEGNPDDPSNQGRNCAKSNAAIATLYNPYRVKYPVKRTNPEKGPGVDPKWVQISWEEAYSTISEKLKKVQKEDSRKFVFISGHGGSMDVEVDGPFTAAFGTPNKIFGGTVGGCGGGSSPFNTWINGHGHTRADMLYCNYFLNLGGSSQQGAKGNPEEVDAYVKARSRGLKVVNVAPMIAPSLAKSDEWVPIIPGTAGALLLAMIYTILHELKVYDTEFLKKRSNAPYLIGEDGLYVRSSENLTDDPIRLDKLGKPLIWDAREGKAKVFDDQSIQDFALEGTFTVNGKSARPAFEVLKEHTKAYPPEKMADISSIPAETIRRLAREWVEQAQIGSSITIDGTNFPFRPVAIIAEQGSKCHVDNYQVMMATKILSMLVGAVDCPGSAKAATAPDMVINPVDGVSKSTITYTSIKKPNQIDFKDLNPTGSSSPMAYVAIKDPQAQGIPYDVEVLGFHGGNPQALLADRDAVTAAFKKVPFVFAISLVFDEPTEQADIVLPESSWLERYGIAGVFPHTSYTDSFKKKGTSGIRLRQPVVEPVYDTKEGNQILLELAEKIGILYAKKGVLERLNASLKLKAPFLLELNKKYTWEEVTDLRLKSAVGPDKSLDWFKKNKGVFYKKPYSVHDYYGATKYQDLRVPIYFEEFVVFRNKLQSELSSKGISLRPSNDFVLSYYTPLPIWMPHPEHKAPPETDLYCINYKNMQHHYGTDNAWAMELTEAQDPYSLRIWMNSEIAWKKGLKDGDKVEVESFTGGKVEGIIKTSQCIHPQVTAIGGCFGHRSVNIVPSSQKGPNFNTLNKISEEYIDPIVGNIDRDTRVKIQRI